MDFDDQRDKPDTMNSFEFNKTAGAVLGSLLLVFGLNEVSSAIYHHDKPEKAGFLIEVAEAAETAGGEAAAAEPLPVLLAKADATKGAATAKACLACHSVDEAGENKTGPALWDVVERNMGASAGFAYSEGLTAKAGEKWTYEALNLFIQNPKGYIKGTKMAYGGLKNDAKRADLLAYLATLSKAPKPFPAQ
jgi:cytochrome c